MKQANNEVRIGLAFIIAVVLFYFGANFLKGHSALVKEYTYYVVYNQISGLASSSVITTNGYKVGAVSDIIYNYDTPDRIVVKLGVNKDLRIPKGSRVYLMNELLGGVSLDLRLASNSEFYVEGDTLEAGVSYGLMGKVESEMLPQVNAMLPKIDSLVISLNAIANSVYVGNTLANIAEVTHKLNVTAGELNRLLQKDIPLLVEPLANTVENMEQITSQLANIDYVATLSKVDSIVDNLQLISAALLTDENTVGRLLNDTTFYDNLTRVCTNANMLIEDIKQHPSRYINVSVFGRKE